MKPLLFIEPQDSFVHTLAYYFRQTGAEVTTLRFDHAQSYLNQQSFDLMVLSPEPSNPQDFCLNETIELVIS